MTLCGFGTTNWSARPAPAAGFRAEMFMWPATWQGDRGRQFNRQKGLGKWIFFQEGSFGTLD